MISSIRTSAAFRRLRRSWFAHDVLRPIWDRQQLRAWWRAGRPNPPPHAVKLSAMLYLADSIGARCLVETGAYLGDTVRALQGRFDKLYSIELAPELARPLQKEFGGDPTIAIVVGDSGQKMAEVVPALTGPAVFWLDAHYSGGPTLGEGSVPIYAEVDMINRLCRHPHAILIDDMKDFTGAEGYPTVEALKSRMEGMGYRVSVFNNMMHCLPG